MQNTKVLKKEEGRAVLLKGMEEVFDAVKCTYGGNGKNVVYNKWSGTPVASNDGENIADQVILEDAGEAMGANLIKQVARSTNAELEDGSTATIINSYTLSKEGNDLVNSDKKISPMRLRKEMMDAGRKVVELLKEKAYKIENVKDLEALATTSVEDPEYGKIIAKVIDDSGDNGIVYVNESEEIGMSVEQDQGYQFNQGLITKYLIKNPDRMETILENPFVLVTEMPLKYPSNDFIKLLDEIIRQKIKDVLIVCDEIDPRNIDFAVMNLFQGKMNIAIVKKPMQKEYLDDIAATVGANAMTQNKGLIHPKFQYLGRAKKVVCNLKKTTIYIDETKQKGLDEYVASMIASLETAEGVVEKTKIQERIAKLTGKIFTVNVGAKTEAGLKQLRDKTDDAVNSLKKVWKNKEEGVVAGGGIALFEAGKELIQKGIQTKGEGIVYPACFTTLRQMLENGGDEDMLKDILEKGGGYNALTMEYVPDMFKAGIIDSTKVIATSFLNCVDFAADFVTYENVIIPLPEKTNIDNKINK
jgi:chaperonin GroEL